MIHRLVAVVENSQRMAICELEKMTNVLVLIRMQKIYLWFIDQLAKRQHLALSCILNYRQVIKTQSASLGLVPMVMRPEWLSTIPVAFVVRASYAS